MSANHHVAVHLIPWGKHAIARQCYLDSLFLFLKRTAPLNSVDLLMKCSALARTDSRPLLAFSISPTTDTYLPSLSTLSPALNVLRHIAVRCIAHAIMEWVASPLNLQKSYNDPFTVVASIHCAERR